jgi:hypothetical protein
MPITPTNTVDPTVMAKNWGPGVQANSQKWLYKYEHPKTLFNANPEAALTAWNQAVTNAAVQAKYKKNLAAADPNAAAAAAETYGVQRYHQSGTQKSAKYAAKTPALATLINSALASIASLPKGKGANNQARMVAFSNAMEAGYGKI